MTKKKLSEKEKVVILAGIGIAGAVAYFAYKTAKPEEDCTEGDVKTYACLDGTEITTHICEDGKWVETGEVCPSDECIEGFLDKERCVSTTLQRKYQFTDCSTEWRDFEFNSLKCIGYCRLYGKVVDQEGYSVPHALISLVGRTTGKTYTQHTGTAGWAGDFDFEKILVDTYDVYIKQTGYADSHYVEANLASDEEYERTYVLSREALYSRLYGEIIDQYGDPVAFAMMQLKMKPTGNPEYTQMASANGNFDFHKVDCGIYIVYIGNTPGYKNVQYIEDLSTAGEYYKEYVMEKL